MDGLATVVAGALVDRHGVRPVFRWSVLIFVIGAVGASFAPSMEVLVAAQMVVEVIHHKAEPEQPIQVAVAVVV